MLSLNSYTEALSIDEFLALARAALPIIDVRSPAEFQAGHIPAAHNVPLFDDDERAEIGTLFKKEGRDPAVMRGLEIVGPKLRALVAAAAQIAGPQRRLLVHCWRGGMRSGSFCWLMNTAGLEARPLAGGYKSFRRKVLAHFDTDMKIVILGGMTGTGKSETLRALAARGLQVLDLEGLAHHKGSAFGALGEAPQPKSEQFENDMFHILAGFDPARVVLMEDESRNIGQVGLPASLFAKMQLSPMVLLEMPAAERSQRLIVDYGGFAKEQLLACCLRIEKRLGSERCRMVQEWVRAGDFKAAALMLLDYYDKSYAHQIAKKRSSQLIRVTIPSASPCDFLGEIQAAIAAISC